MKPGRQRQGSSLAPRPSQLAEDELLKHIYGASISEHVCRLIAALKTDHGSLDLTGLAITAPAPPNLLHSSSSSLLTNCSAGDSINALVFATVHHSKDKQLPYIRVGDKFMLFTHPNKHLPIFSDASSKNHASSSNPNNSSLSPSTSSAQTHLFDLVQSAYFTMKSRHQDQSIILSGEAGSGKSLSHRLITRQLCDLSKSSKKKTKVTSNILKVDSVLSAFGNSVTATNDNASSHGIYVEYQFDRLGKLVGAKVIPFLLDRYRVTGFEGIDLIEGRNFHIFYYMLAGLDASQRQQLKINETDNPDTFRYLSKYSKRTSVSSDYQNFMDLCKNLRDLGIGRRQQAQLFNMLAAILHLGNITFEEVKDSTSEPCKVKNRTQLDLTAALLGLDSLDLEAMLTIRIEKVGVDRISALLNAKEALSQTDSLARTLYTIATTWLFDRINHKLCSDELSWTNFIAVLDVPGTRGMNSSSPDLNDFGTLMVNYTNSRILDFTEEVYRSPSVTKMFQAEGISNPCPVSKHSSESLCVIASPDFSSSACSNSIFSCIETMCNSFRSPPPDQVLDNLVEICGSSQAFMKKSTSKSTFGIRHHSGCLVEYSVNSLCSRNKDVIQEDFIGMFAGSEEMEGSVNRFLKSLVNDCKSNGSAEPREKLHRVPTLKRKPTIRADAIDKGVPTVFSMFKEQLNEIFECLSDTNSWFVFHIQPSSGSSYSSSTISKLDFTSIRSQLAALDLVGIASNPLSRYSAWMSFHEFNSKYQETLNDHLQYILPSTSESKEGNQQTLAMDIDHALQTGLGWKRRQYYVGDSMVFLSIDSWSLLEKMVKDRIKSERRLNCNNDNNDNNTDSIIGMSPNTSFTGYSSDAESFYASECESELLEKSSQSPLSLTADIEKGIHSSCPKKAVLTTTTDINQLLPKKSTSKVRSCWLAYVWLSTWWIPSCCLSHCGKMRSKDQRIAWREKISLFFIILLFCGIILFFIVGLGWIVCPVRRAMSVGEIQDHSKLSSSSPDPYVYMYGEYFDARSEANTHISRSGGDTKYLWEEKVLGQDVSQLFNKEGYWDDYCNFDKPNSFILFPTQLKELAKGKLVDHLSTQASDPQNYIPSIRRKWLRGVVVWNKDSLSQLDGDNKKILVMYNRVYDVSSMFYGNTDANFFLGHSSDIHDDMKSLIKTFTSSVGSDASSKMDKIRAKSLEEWKDIMGCMKGLFYIGQIDHRNDLQCMIPNYILLVAAAILVSVIGFKFIAALQLGTKRQPEHRDKFVICMVTCYTEGEQSISKTINALAVTKFDDRHKLLFVICDGMIIGAGNDQPTPRLVLNLLGVDPLLDATSLKFQSLGEGNKQLNYGKVYSGLYCIQGRSVPFVVVVKVGKPTERQRPGNRGKRDSQLILMKFLSKVYYNQPLSPLELEIFHHINNVIGIDPCYYEFLLTVDADTEVAKDSLNRLVSCMVRDSKISGLCGETKISNEKSSWVTMIQVYEYYISHHLSKAFESLFGTVTCLPGCFTMFRIRTAVGNKPILISKGLVTDYSENDVDTLHLKNLLHLGEDRYLTTLLLKHFPYMKTSFTPDARASTVSPDKWSVILSQRRRWINSTIHNLLELLFLPEMCGFCCFSMRFIVFIDLFATVIQPTALLYVIYLVIITILIPEQNLFPMISIIMISCVYGAQVIIFILKRQWQHIGWMIIYLLAMPVFSFWLPLYAFWHFDDFSWGSTRLVVGDDGKKKIVAQGEEEFDPSSIPLKSHRDDSAPLSSTSSKPFSFVTPPSPYIPAQRSPLSESSSILIVPNRQSFVSPQVTSLFQRTHPSPLGTLSLPFEPPASPTISYTSYPQHYPSDNLIAQRIKELLQGADLMKVTKKTIREQLSFEFGVDLTPKKPFIHEYIDKILKGEV